MPRRSFLVLAIGAAAASPVLASEAGGGGGSVLITPQFGLIFWTVLTFVLLAILLGRFAWRPLLGAIEERERTIRESLEQARRDREEARALLEQHRSLLTQARRERAEAVAAGQRDAERVKVEILEEAKTQREQLLRQTDVQIAALIRQAREDLRGVAADLAVQAAGKLLAKNLDDATQRRLVEDYLKDLGEFASGPSAKA